MFVLDEDDKIHFRGIKDQVYLIHPFSCSLFVLYSYCLVIFREFSWSDFFILGIFPWSTNIVMFNFRFMISSTNSLQKFRLVYSLLQCHLRLSKLPENFWIKLLRILVKRDGYPHLGCITTNLLAHAIGVNILCIRHIYYLYYNMWIPYGCGTYMLR